jgi:coatomer subunit gamma
LEIQDITNTLPDTVLQEVSIISTAQDPEDGESAIPLEEDFLIPLASLATNDPGTVYVAFKNVSGEKYPTCSFTNILKFTSKEIDPSTGEPEDTGYEDEYQIEDLELGGTDYVVPAFAGSWEAVWDGTSGGDEAMETLVLSNAKDISGKLRCSTQLVTATGCLTPYQMPLPSSQTCFNYNPWMAVMFLCRTQRMLSNFMERRSTTAKSRSWSAWHTLLRMV